uniref:Dynein light chain n=1 Tax=Kalanchoe fedtschenkoi TaxID=63787 RepID=A0A7N0ZRA6_KALFE
MEKTSVEQKRKVALAPAVRQAKEERKSTSSDSSAAKKKVVIKSADMLDDMQKEAIDIAVAAFEQHSVEKDVAEFIKKEFDTKHGPTWHCIVGRNFDCMKNCGEPDWSNRMQWLDRLKCKLV